MKKGLAVLILCVAVTGTAHATIGDPGNIAAIDEVELVIDITTGDATLVANDAIVAGYQITSASGSLEPGDIITHFESQPSLSTTDITDANLFAAGVAVPPNIYVGDIWNTSGSMDLVFSWTDDRNFETVEGADVQYVPEPATMALLGLGGLGALLRRRRA